VRILRLIAFLLVLLACGGTPLLPQALGSAEAEIRSVMTQIRTASLDGDSDKVSSLMADEYLQTDISGHV
jgi:hypothetical protein